MKVCAISRGNLIFYLYCTFRPNTIFLYVGRILTACGFQSTRLNSAIAILTAVYIYILGKRHISILSTKNVIWTFFWRPPQPPLETSRTFFDTAETPETLFILQV